MCIYIFYKLVRIYDYFKFFGYFFKDKRVSLVKTAYLYCHFFTVYPKLYFIENTFFLILKCNFYLQTGLTFKHMCLLLQKNVEIV